MLRLVQYFGIGTKKEGGLLVNNGKKVKITHDLINK